jgi:hypothetical protein
MKTYLRTTTVEAQQVTAQDFDGPNPSEHHVPGWTYFPSTRTATPSKSLKLFPPEAYIGDWIIRDEHGAFSVVKADVFEQEFKPVVIIRGAAWGE